MSASSISAHLCQQAQASASRQPAGQAWRRDVLHGGAMRTASMPPRIAALDWSSLHMVLQASAAFSLTAGQPAEV